MRSPDAPAHAMTGHSNLRIFTLFSAVWGVTFGLIGPFYAVYIAEIGGGLEKLGYAYSIMIFVQAVTSFFVGHSSDKHGRKPYLFFTSYLNSAILLCYTVITLPYQIYILQALLGVSNAISMTMRDSLLGDITRREKRGFEVGRFNAIVSIFSSMGLAAGGYATKFYGIKALFYFGSVVVALSTILLFFIREPRKD